MFVRELARSAKKELVGVAPSIHVTVCAVSVSPSTFRAVLDYMYLGHASVEAACVTDVLSLANEFSLHSLKDQCNAFLENQRSSLTRSNGSIRNAVAGPCNVAEDASNEDCFQKVLKSEIKSENDNSKCVNILGVSTLKIVKKYKRKCLRPQHIAQDDIVPIDMPKLVGTCEEGEFVEKPLPNDNQNEIQNHLIAKVTDTETNILRKSACEKPAAGKSQLRKLKRKKLKIKVGVRVNSFVARCDKKLEGAVEGKKLKGAVEVSTFDHVLNSDLVVKKEENDVDTPQYTNSFRSEKNRFHSGFNLGNRKRGRPRKELAGDNIVATICRNSSRFSCFWCNFKCKWTRELGAHIVAAHFPEPPYKCDLCGRTVGGVEQLLRHRRYHTEKRFECITCNKQFRLKGTLTQHLRLHTGRS